MLYTISQLYVYPIKSLKGIALQQAELTPTGFAYDRYWMLVDQEGKAITQREIPELALFRPQFDKEQLIVSYQNEQLKIPLHRPPVKKEIEIQFFDKRFMGSIEATTINEWFSDMLNQSIYLVRPSLLKERFMRRHPDAKINFPDSSQYLILGEASLHNLNTQLDTSIDINRFRANIIFTGGAAHDEDEWQSVQIGTATFQKNKLCARCIMTTIDQKNATLSKEPLKTLAKYRKKGNKVLFGSYLKLMNGVSSNLTIGDTILPIQ